MPQSELDKLRGELFNARNDVKALESELDETRRAADAITKSHKEMQRQRNEISAQLSSARTAVIAEAERATRAEERAIRTESEIKRLLSVHGDRVSKIDAEISELRADLRASQTLVGELRDENRKLRLMAEASAPQS